MKNGNENKRQKEDKQEELEVSYEIMTEEIVRPSTSAEQFLMKIFSAIENLLFRFFEERRFKRSGRSCGPYGQRVL